MTEDEQITRLQREVKRLRGVAEIAEARGVKAERARCVAIARAHDGAPCRPAPAWTAEQIDWYISGQQDASRSIAATLEGGGV